MCEDVADGSEEMEGRPLLASVDIFREVLLSSSERGSHGLRGLGAERRSKTEGVYDKRNSEGESVPVQKRERKKQTECKAVVST